VDLLQITILAAAAALYLALLPARWRGWALYLGSLVAIYWLQPPLAIRWLDYALPTASIALAALAWWITRPAGARPTRDDAAALAAALIVITVLALPRYLDLPLTLTTRPPPAETVAAALLLLGLAALAVRRALGPRRALAAALIALIGLFIVLKLPPLTEQVARLLRLNAGQDPTLAASTELGWLGFSYLAFRLIHTFRDRQSGLLPALSLRETVTYAIFAPAYTAGPIARAEEFAAAYRPLAGMRGLDPDRITQGLTRIGVGLFRKFVVADSLAVFSLSPALLDSALTPGAVWVMLYAYGLRLYFDFSGYTDIAIGLALLLGIPLPENFDRPYLKANLTAFWQSWHISLTDWARFYIYSPLSRALLRRQPRPANAVIILIASAATMITIGLWHNLTLPFLLFGLWHTAGLFAHKRWTDRTRTWYRGLTARRRQAWTVAGVLLTFHFVLLGWVWFAMPTLPQAIETFSRLAGLGER
jgi:alginate O-acetyltransferase complex protein AlgI